VAGTRVQYAAGMSLDDARKILDAARRMTDAAVAAASKLTANGEKIDEHQVIVDRVAYAATEVRAATELFAAGEQHANLQELAIAGVSELARSARDRLDLVAGDLEVDTDLYVKEELRRAGHESRVRAIGLAVAEARGKNAWPLDATLAEVRGSVRTFAEREVAPHAARIHAHDELVPDRIIEEMGKLGYFGL